MAPICVIFELYRNHNSCLQKIPKLGKTEYTQATEIKLEWPWKIFDAIMFG